MRNSQANKTYSKSQVGMTSSNFALVFSVCSAMLAGGCEMRNSTTVRDVDGKSAVTMRGAAASLKGGVVDQDIWRFVGNTADTQAMSSDSQGLTVGGGGVVRGLAIETEGLGRFTLGGMSRLGVRDFRYAIDPETGAPTLTIGSIDDDTVGVIEAMTGLERAVGLRFTAFTGAQRDVFIETFSAAVEAGVELVTALERAFLATASAGASEAGGLIGAAINGGSGVESGALPGG